ncbi:MAG: TonB-dependent receptor [Vicinamibacterales bacterium]
MRKLTMFLCIVAGLLVVPAAAYAQASITGVVRDTSGAVLPGVTVEAASPALIEKVRSVVSDGNGQYRVIDLRPGAYTVTFTLPGFRTFRREGIELTGTFIATVNADMAVGSLEETITVTSASPIVDVQSARQQEVIGRDVIEAVPTTRTAFGLATLIPALTSNNGSDSGGTNSISLVFLTTHGSRVTDQRVTMDGLSTNSAEGGGQYSAYMPNMGSTQEMAVDYAGGTAEMETGGVRINVIPRDGGNVFRGMMFVGGTTSSLQTTNLTDELKTRGLPTGTGIRKLWDYNPGFGGPILKDKLWFYASARYNGENTYSGGFDNANANNPARWDYVAAGRPSEIWHEQHSLNGRVTWQINAKNKLSFFHDDQWRCSCPNTLSVIEAPESSTYWHYPWADLTSITWSSPQTNRLLIEAGVQRHPEQWHSAYSDTPNPDGQVLQLPGFIQVTDQSNGRNYRGRTSLTTNDMLTWRSRASVSYVTGSHSFKVGFGQHHATRDWLFWEPKDNVGYTFNRGVPTSLTQYLRPELIRATIPLEIGIFVQDQWTIGKLTANMGVRYDHLETDYPEATLGPTTFAPNRNILLPKQDQLNWNDIVPRLSAAYDVFGDGKTAIKTTLNKYVLAIGLQGFFGDGSNPVNLYGNQTSRSWTDNGDFVPNCDLLSPLANGECGAMANQNFGKPLRTAAIDPEILRGWGSRPYNWEFGASVQQQVTQQVSVDVGFFRRWYGNFTAKDNRATTIADYDKFTITAPVDSRLPNGGGYTVGPLYDLKPEKVGVTDNYYTFAKNYGDQTEVWNGVDIGINTRLPRGVILQGGVSTGRTVTDNCDIVAVSPEIESGISPASATLELSQRPAGVPYCNQNSGFLTNLKGFGSYTIPKLDVQISATIQSYDAAAAAGSQITNPIFSMVAANYVATNAVVSPSLGRNLSGGASNMTVNLIAPGSIHGDRVQQLDMSFGKILRFGRTRSNLKLEVFNLLNSSAVLTENAAYGSFRGPLSILQARFAKVGVQFDF